MLECDSQSSIQTARGRFPFEIVLEVTQIKGDGETHPALSPNDEFADYFRRDKGNFGLQGEQPGMLPREYARQALMRGLKYEAELGANPFKFGLYTNPTRSQIVTR